MSEEFLQFRNNQYKENQHMFKALFAKFRSVMSGEPVVTTTATTADSLPDSLEGCLRAYKNALTDSPTEGKILDKITKIARSIRDWIEIYSEVSQESKLGKKAMEKLKEFARSFNDWNTILDIDGIDRSFATVAIEKMAGLATTFEEWSVIAGHISDGWIVVPETVSIKMESELTRLAQTFDQWLALYNKAEKEGTLKLLAVQKIIAMGSGVSQLVLLYQNSTEGSASRAAVLAGIRNSSASFRDWKRAYNEDVSSELSTVALEKMSSSAITFSEWTEVCDWAEERGEVSILDCASKEVLKLDGTFDEWKELFEKANEDSEFELAITPMAIAAARSISELVDLYKCAGGASKAEGTILEAIKTRTDGDFDDWESIYQDDESTDELCDVAFGKMERLMSDLDDVIKLSELADGNDDRMKGVFASFDRLRIDRQKAIEWIESGECPHSMDSHVLEWLFAGSASVLELIELDLVIRNEDIEDLDVPDGFEAKIAEKVAESASPSELKIISILISEDSDIKAKVDERLALVN